MPENELKFGMCTLKTISNSFQFFGIRDFFQKTASFRFSKFPSFIKKGLEFQNKKV